LNRFALPALLAVVFLGAAPAQAHDEGPRFLRDALVRSVERAPFGSGMLAAWNHWIIETPAGTAIELFSLEGPKPPPPLPGQRCDVRYHIGFLGGSVGPGLKTNAPWAMVDHFTCTGQPSAPNP
jgi:hypothetical protein